MATNSAYALTLSTTLLPAQSRIMEIDGENNPGGLGAYDLAALGDTDGDGAPDFAVLYYRMSTPSGPGTGRITVHSGADGRVLYRIDGTPGRKILSMAAVGDVDKDGYPDIAVGAPEDGSAAPNGGSVTVYSGLTGRPVRYWTIAHSGARMGWDVAPASDLNRDGHADVLVGFFFGTLYDPTRPSRATGEARVLSGKDGSVIHKIIDPVGIAFGAVTDSAGDLDRDGYTDFYLRGAAPGRLEAYSGRTGKLITAYGSPHLAAPLIANLGDVDGDGVPDLGLGRPAGLGQPATGVVEVFSNGLGKVLYSYQGQPGDNLMVPLALGDLDGDGHADFAAGAAGPTFGYVQAWSGRTGTPMFRVTTRRPNELFGSSLASLGDVTGDAVPEFLVASRDAVIGPSTIGRTTMYSPVQLSLTADRHRASVSQATTQLFDLDAGPAHASQRYWLFGSMSGTRPGTPLGRFTVPLNADPYTAVILGGSNNGVFWQFRGQLDAVGRARPELRLPALPPTPGFTLHHAAVVYRSDGTILRVTNPVSLRLEN